MRYHAHIPFSFVVLVRVLSGQVFRLLLRKMGKKNGLLTIHDIAII